MTLAPDYRRLALGSRAARVCFLFNAALVLHDGRHDGIVFAGPAAAGRDLYARARKLGLYGAYLCCRPRRHRNAVRRLMRALDRAQPGLTHRLAERAMILGGFAPRPERGPA